MHDIRKFVEGASESVTYELNKCSRENNNLVNWLKLYDKQIKDYEKEIYHLKLRSYFSAQYQLSPHQLPQHQLPHQPLQHQPPIYISLADYFRNQE